MSYEANPYKLFRKKDVKPNPAWRAGGYLILRNGMEVAEALLIGLVPVLLVAKVDFSLLRLSCQWLSTMELIARFSVVVSRCQAKKQKVFAFQTWQFVLSNHKIQWLSRSFDERSNHKSAFFNSETRFR
jgi:hypothetical protein